VIVAVICIIIYYRKNKKAHPRRSSILSTPDAMMIASTFRQAMTTPDKTRDQIGQDILNRQLESEGTSVLQVERHRDLH
jgi:hypothetical protein